MTDSAIFLWPRENVNEDKTKLILEKLIEHKFIKDLKYRNNDEFISGRNIWDFLEIDATHNDYDEDDKLTIGIESRYIIADDWVNIDKWNTVYIYNLPDYVMSAEKLCAMLKEITGDLYEAVKCIDGFFEGVDYSE